MKQFFGKDPHKGVNPDEVVAAGAALQGAVLQGEGNVEVLLLDVTPLSLGVETGGGVFTPLIPRNTTIPTDKSEIFTTSVDNQSFVPIHVLQGERKMAADNRSLNRFELTGIPPAPRGVPKIQVTFRIDANGVVSIEAKDLGTGRAQTMKVTPTSGLSQDDVSRLVSEGEKSRQADDMRRELADLKNQAETLLYTTGAALDGYADLVDAEVLDKARKQAAHLRSLLDTGSDLAQLREAHQTLEAMVYAIAEKMYSRAKASSYNPGMGTAMTDSDRAGNLIYDWNEIERRGRLIPKTVTFFDETLRDGLQNPSVAESLHRRQAPHPSLDG